MEKYEIALKEVPLDEGITPQELYDLATYKLSELEVIPYEVQGNGSVAVGCISLSAAKLIDYKYGEDTDLYNFIKSILNNEARSNDCLYTFEGNGATLNIYLE